jgi:hypothetical protein
MTVSEAASAEIAAYPPALRSSALAAAVQDLARRLDDGPGDRDAAGLVRELRLALQDLRRLAETVPEGGLDVSDATMDN